MGGSETAYDANTMIDQLTETGSSSVSLVIPCRPEYVALCRLVAGALGLRDGLPEEVVADIKVMVTEACNCFLAMAGSGHPGRIVCAGAQESGPSGPGPGGSEAEGVEQSGCSIHMDFDSRPDAFVISVLYPERRELVSWVEGCDPMSEAGLGLTILKALADEMVEIDTPGGTVLRLTRFLPA
jgi:hypothetical protein